MSVLKFIKGALGMCQCDGCQSRWTSKITMLRADGTTYHLYVCDDCEMEIYKLYKVK